MTTSGTPGDRPSVSTGRTSTQLGVWEGGLLETASSMNSECVCVCSWHTVQGYVTEWLSSHMLGRGYEAECGCTFCVAPCVPSGKDALSVEGTQWCHITSPSLLPPPLSGETSRWLLWAVRAVIWQPCTPDNIPQGSCGYDCSCLHQCESEWIVLWVSWKTLYKCNPLLSLLKQQFMLIYSCLSELVDENV